MKEIIYQTVQLIRQHQHLLSTNRFTAEAALLEEFFNGPEIAERDKTSRQQNQLAIQFLFHGFFRLRQGISAVVNSLLQPETAAKLPAIDFIYVCMLVYLVLFDRESLKSSTDKIPDGFDTIDAILGRHWMRGTAGKHDQGGMGRLASDVSLQILGAVVDLLEQVQSAQENDPNVTAADVKHFISSRLTVDGQRLLAGLEEFYELSFIIDSILQPMFDERLPLVRRMMAEIHDTLHSIPVPAKSNKPLTEPEPFLLTKIEPRKILVPQPIPSVIKAHPVPVSHYTKLPKAEMAIERSRHKHRIEQRDRLLQSDLKQFEVVKKTEEMIRQKREEAERAKLNSKPATNVPVIKRNGTASWTEALKSGKAVEVKKTNAEILRQEAYVRKRREDERRKFETELSQGVAGTMTDKEFELFEQQVRIQDESDSKLRQHRLRLQVQLSKEEAQLAKELAHQRKSNIAAETRSETNRLQEEALQRSIERTKEKLYIIEQVQIGREHKRKVQQKILDDRREQAADMDRESEERWQQRERELAEERARKAELIKQIRAMEQAALANIHLMKETKQLDLTETSGISLLTEMSIVELQERLRLMKIREAEEEQEKRERIQTIKQQQQMFINEKLRLVEEYHRESQAKEQLKRELHAYKDDQSRALSILSVSTKCSTVRSLLNGETSEFDKMKRIQAKLDKVRMQRRRLEQEKSQLGRAGHPADFTEEPEKEKAKQFADEMFSYVDNAF